jgi:hypothetical protein
MFEKAQFEGFHSALVGLAYDLFVETIPRITILPKTSSHAESQVVEPARGQTDFVACPQTHVFGREVSALVEFYSAGKSEFEPEIGSKSMLML